MRTKEEKAQYHREWFRRWFSIPENREKRRLYSKEYYYRPGSKKRSGQNSRDFAREYRNRIRIIVMTHYSKDTPVCTHCGITDVDVLTIDHILGGGSQHRRLGGGNKHNICSWLYSQGLPSGYQVLCRNCNYKKFLEEQREPVGKLSRTN